MRLIEKSVYCPYCGENITVFIDDSIEQQDYYEDCQVCCRPIRFLQTVSVDGGCDVCVLRDDE